MDSEDKLLKLMQTSFRQEMGERLLVFSQQLALLEDLHRQPPESDLAELTTQQEGILATMMRELHNLKGAARAVNLPEIENLCHAVEGLLSIYQHANMATGLNIPKLFDLLYQSVDWFDHLLNCLNLDQALNSSELDDFISLLQGQVATATSTSDSASLLQGQVATAIPPATSSSSSNNTGLEQLAVSNRQARQSGTYKGPATLNTTTNENSVRVSGAKLDELLAASSELLVARLRMRQHREEINLLVNDSQSWSRLWRNVRATHSRLRQRTNHDADLTNLLRFVALNEQRIRQLENGLVKLHNSFSRDLTHLSVVTDQLQFETRRLRLIPLSVVIEELERSIRQLARELGKQVQLVVHGAELEIDKKLLDEIKAPLLHLLRNALDHGLESPAQRLHNGKLATGTITISFHQSGGSIELEVQDDGAGIDVIRIKEVAIERGILKAEAATELDRTAAMQFIFDSGFSTRTEVNGISGRGIGLDSVKEVATRLGGHVEVDSWPGSGTRFHFSVPNILITTEGILIKTNNQTFVVPVSGVEHSFRASEVTLQNIGSRQYLFYKDTQVVLTSLTDMLGLASGDEATTSAQANPYIVVLQSRGRFAAFTVDTLLKSQEVVIKSFSKPLMRVRYVAGATILADGQVALILNPDDLISMAVSELTPSPSLTTPFRTSIQPETGLATTTNTTKTYARPTWQAHILVVDDSITTRTLEKNILEAAGFYVRTASNGVEALIQLRTEEFDLVVADMEMPEMNGLELIRIIKKDNQLAETPVIIVTSLDTVEDKTKGLEVGADAYMVKSRFDQQDLLSTVRQLV
jgi:two-component system chemotaxis sensor kinase CheA